MLHILPFQILISWLFTWFDNSCHQHYTFQQRKLEHLTSSWVNFMVMKNINDKNSLTLNLLMEPKKKKKNI